MKKVSSNKDEEKKKVIRSTIILEIIGKPAEHLIKTLEDIIKRIGEEKGVKVVDKKLNEFIPDSPNKPYDIKEVVLSIVDNQDFLEVLPLYAKNIVTGFARMGGMTVGIVANQPAYLAGVLDINASRKGARFIRFCDAFNIPIVTLVDVPGYLPGT